MKIIKVHTTYHVELKTSEYDFAEVVKDEDGRITVKFLEGRWREIDETIEMFKEIIENLKKLK